MKLKNILALVFFLGTISTYAQLTIDAEIRPRFEYRHGFKTLYPDNANPGAFVSQRTRLNTSFKEDKLDFYLSLQDVRVWGDVAQLNQADKNGLAVHEGWARFAVDSSFAVKVGRQEIVYDDSRIFGNVGWAQQARSHDAALVQYKKGKLKADLGVAFNQDKENLTGTTLNNLKTYKAFQYLWLHQDFAKVSASFLFLNNGVQHIDIADQNKNETRYSQTVGTHIKTKGKVALTANAYFQFGKNQANENLNAYLLALEAKTKVSKKTLVALGGEMLSGNDNTNSKNTAFSPFYGTNHKFNGFMDYFYVGNHFNNVGLLDIYAKVNHKLNAKSSLTGFLHKFSAAPNVNKKQFGYELDLVYGYKMQKNVALKVGYSRLFKSGGLEALKGITQGNINDWGWVMLVIKPTLFKGKKN